MKLIVGLGNPGRKYQGTRHNIGFRVIAELHERFGKPRPAARFDSELVQIQVPQVDSRVLLQSPLTYMNESGRAVRGVFDFYKLELSEILVICDDFNLEPGRLRCRPSGSAGGQNGLKDIIRKLGSQDFSRLRIGVGKPLPGRDVSRYVLGKFTAEDGPLVEKAVGRAADAALVWLEHGTATCMNRYNADPDRQKPPRPPSGGKPAGSSGKPAASPDRQAEASRPPDEAPGETSRQ